MIATIESALAPEELAADRLVAVGGETRKVSEAGGPPKREDNVTHIELDVGGLAAVAGVGAVVVELAAERLAPEQVPRDRVLPVAETDTDRSSARRVGVAGAGVALHAFPLGPPGGSSP